MKQQNLYETGGGYMIDGVKSSILKACPELKQIAMDFETPEPAKESEKKLRRIL